MPTAPEAMRGIWSFSGDDNYEGGDLEGLLSVSDYSASVVITATGSPYYYDLDLLLAIRINNRLSANLKIINTLNTAYGGIDVKEQDVDLQYNPQLGRCIRVGFSYDF